MQGLKIRICLIQSLWDRVVEWLIAFLGYKFVWLDLVCVNPSGVNFQRTPGLHLSTRWTASRGNYHELSDHFKVDIDLNAK